MSHHQPYGQQPEYPQQPYGQQPAYPPAQPPRKSWPARHKFLTAVMVVAGLAVVGGVAGGAGSGTSPSTSSPANVAGGAAPGKASAPAKPATWHTLAKLSGSGNKRGPVFTIGDGRVRMRYTVRNAESLTVVGIYVVREGKSLSVDGGIPEATLDQDGSDSTELAQKPGNYYLDVLAAGSDWSVVVEQLQ